ncbi:MAG: LytR/AlgR family response regulator transcription factor [Tractidigestivibacter sp.]|jgi:DNA-binding LytR/AlgR family response regulator|uniref:LytR/AlgR family response regulator transcription factor n=1 Tax=Tractidigestivibacter sp. TaxID=2847320 RepID=UPI003D8CCD1F
MYRILMVEDDEAEADSLRHSLERYARENKLEFQITWTRTALDISTDSTKYDLIFMDIGLPGINGMEAATLIRTYDPETPIIFVTNLAQYAVRGYEVDALDFVLKPVSYYNFKMRMDKAMRVIKRSAGKSIVVSAHDGLRVILTSELVAVEISNHSLVYHLAGDEDPIVVRGSLSKVEDELVDAPFVRISNSCLLNMAYVRTVKGSEVHTTTGDVYYFSRSKRHAAIDKIAKYLGGSI